MRSVRCESAKQRCTCERKVLQTDMQRDHDHSCILSCVFLCNKIKCYVVSCNVVSSHSNRKQNVSQYWSTVEHVRIM